MQLPCCEDGHYKREPDDESDDGSRFPRMFVTTPLYCQEQHHHGGDEEEKPWEVEMFELSEQWKFGGWPVVGAEEKEKDDGCDGSEREVDVETPSPGEVLSESSTK